MEWANTETNGAVAMTFAAFKWLLAVASLVGVVLNIQHRRACFAVWLVTNSCWVVVDVVHEVYAQAVLQTVYAGLSVWGLILWKRQHEQTKDHTSDS